MVRGTEHITLDIVETRVTHSLPQATEIYSISQLKRSPNFVGSWPPNSWSYPCNSNESAPNSIGQPQLCRELKIITDNKKVPLLIIEALFCL